MRHLGDFINFGLELRFMQKGVNKSRPRFGNESQSLFFDFFFLPYIINSKTIDFMHNHLCLTFILNLHPPQIYKQLGKQNENKINSGIAQNTNYIQSKSFKLLILAPKTKHEMKNTKQIVVCMTGFVHDPQLPTYKSMLQQLGCKYQEQLPLYVNYLIVSHTCTEKYKIAQLINTFTDCITIKWLEDSAKNKKIMPSEKYKIKKIFYGVKLIIEGFEEKKMQQKIVQLLKTNGAQQVKVGLQGMNSQQIVIIPCMKYYKKIQNKYGQCLSIPLVTPQWLQQSLKCKKCKYPHDYALNYQLLKNHHYDNDTNVKRLNRKLSTMMQTFLLDKNVFKLLCNHVTGQQCIIYLDENSIQPAFIDLLKRLICVCGGLYLNNYGPMVTHVLLGEVQQNQYTKFMNYGDSSHVLRVQWLVDSLIFSLRLPQIDFKVRSFKPPLIKSMNNMQKRQTMHYNRYTQHSQTFLHTYNNNNIMNYNHNSMNPMSEYKNYNSSMPLTALQHKKSIKSISISKQQQVAVKVIPLTKMKSIKSEIFKGKYFYLEKEKKKQPSMLQIYTKIKQNGGYMINETNINMLKNKKLFVVLRDSSNNIQYLQSIAKLAPANNIQYIPISPRWIEECLKKSIYLQYNAQNCFTYKPFMFETPVRWLMIMKIQIVGIDEILKRRYRQLLLALGCPKVSPNIAEITHCLCGKQYNSDARYKQILAAMDCKQKDKDKETVSKESSGSKSTIELSVNNNIKMVREEWLVEFMKNKGKANIEDYIFNI